MVFEKGNQYGGRKKGAQNRLTNDVRECFHKVYEEMGANVEVDGKKLTGHQAFLMWARDNQTDFYRLYGKMIPQTAEIPSDCLENFVDTLVFEEEQARLIEGKAKVIDVENEAEMGNKPDNKGKNGESTPQDSPDNAPPDS